MSDPGANITWLAVASEAGQAALREALGEPAELRWVGAPADVEAVLQSAVCEVAVVVLDSSAPNLSLIAILGQLYPVVALLHGVDGPDAGAQRATLRQSALAHGACEVATLGRLDRAGLQDVMECAVARAETSAPPFADRSIRDTLAAGGVATGIWDIEHDVVTGTANLAGLYGLSPETAEEASLSDYAEAVHVDDRAAATASFAPVTEGHSDAYTAEYRTFKPDGSVRWLHVRGLVERDASGAAVRMSGVVMDITERKLAEQARVAAEHFLRQVLDTLIAFVAVLDIDGTVLDCNAPSLEVAGLEMADLYGEKFWETPYWSLSQQLRDRIHDACTRAASGEVVTFDSNSRVANEATLTVAVQIAPLRNDDGRITHLIASGVDVSERIATAHDLAQSRATLDAVLDALPVAVLVADVDGRIVRENAANRELWGVTPETRTVADYDHWVAWWPDTGERIEADEWAMARVLRTGERVHNELVEYQPFDRDEHRYFLNNAAAIFDPDGQVVAGVVAQLDVTDRLTIERQLHESEQRFRALADNIPQLAWMTDATGAIVWYNRRWFEYTGRTFEEMKGWGWQTVHHPNHVNRVTVKFSERIQSGEPWEDTFPMRGADGRYRWFLSRAMPIRDERGKIVRWFGTHTDISAQRESEQVLRNAVTLRDDFLAVASHELRTPLMTLGLQLELLERTLGPVLERVEEPGRQQLIRRLEVALRQNRRLGRLVEGLLDVSRIASGRLELHHEACNLTAVVHDVVDRHTELAASSESEVRIFAHTAVEGFWDCSRIEQVFANLLTNALKYGRGKPVDVTLEVIGDRVELRVRDRGEGIAPADHRRIFGRFERASPTRHYGGLGLGLFIVEQIVEAHGGAVSVESSPGQGATFIVELPLDSRPTMAPSTAGPETFNA